MNLGVYVHIPFCRKKCDYCNFYSIPIGNETRGENKLIDTYVERLLKEIEVRSGGLNDYMVDTIYFGGGTPSLIQPEYIGKLIEKIRGCFIIDNDKIETTIECNPEDFSAERISIYKDCGINRVVLGIQTLNSRMHAIAGRSSRLCDEGLLSEFRGIDNIIHCVDLMTSFPGQAGEELLGDLDAVVKYRFEHISAYILTVEKGTRLAGRIPNIKDSDDEQRRLFEIVMDYLAAAGYRHYEVSNFALPSFESKHNMKYWQFMPYAGFGAGAHSFYHGERYYNPPSINDYIEKKNPLLKDERNPGAMIVEFLMTGMRLLDGISIKDLEQKTGVRIQKELTEAFYRIKSKGCLEIEDSGNDLRIRFTRDGFFMMDGLIYEMTETLI